MFRGYFENLEIVKRTPSAFQGKLVKMLATNCAKAARIDAQRTCLSGSAGERLKELMLERFKKVVDP
jgi:U4/U6 small nuclear ribonucleoprotein PRP31